MKLIREQGESVADFLFKIFNKFGCTELAVCMNIFRDNKLYWGKRYRYDMLMELEGWRYVPGSNWFRNSYGEQIQLDKPFQRNAYIHNVTHRTVLDIEIMLDIDDTYHNMLEFEDIKQKAMYVAYKTRLFNPSVSFTGNKSYHLGLIRPLMRCLSKQQRKSFREEFIIKNGLFCDMQLCSENVTIALEGAKHYRSQKNKEMVKL